MSNSLRQKIPIFPQFTTLLTGHEKLGSYLHRFGLTDNPMWPCEEEQAAAHSVFLCKELRNRRNEMQKQIINTGGNWPMTNERRSTVVYRFVCSV